MGHIKMRRLFIGVFLNLSLGLTASLSSFATEDNDNPSSRITSSSASNSTSRSTSSTLAPSTTASSFYADSLLSYIASQIPVRVEVTIDVGHYGYLSQTGARSAYDEAQFKALVPGRLKGENPKMVCVANSMEDCKDLGLVIGALRYVSALKTLHVIGYFNKNIVQALGALTTLEKLIFEREAYIYPPFFHHTFTRLQTTGMSYNFFASLVNLQTLDMSNVEFIDTHTSVYYISAEGIPFRTLVTAFGYMKALKVLNLTDATLFPPQPRERSQAYSNWRKREIKDCATLLAANYKGQKLHMVGNDLDAIFLDAFKRQLETVDVTQQKLPVQMDFSDNNIPLKDAASFLNMLTKKKVWVDVVFEKVPEATPGKVNWEMRDARKRGRGTQNYSSKDLEKELFDQLFSESPLD